MESWVCDMERLCVDLYISKKDQMYLAAHCLDEDARNWWSRVRASRLEGGSTVTWAEFRTMLFSAYQ